MKIVVRLLVLLPLLWVEGALAVDCPSTNYYLRYQYEVDALGDTGCDSILGYLTIREYQYGGIDSLTGLSNITSVAGTLSIKYNDLLGNLNGLANLSSVGGGLEIIDNDSLSNIDGLANLTSIGGHLTIQNNSLTDVDGLANLSSVGGRLEIYRANVLINIDGLANLTSLGGESVQIWENSSLLNVDGLANISSFGGHLLIQNNHSLTNVDGLANLSSVGALSITGNSALTNVDGLVNLNSAGALSIKRNNSLTNVDGLVGLSTTGSDLTASDIWGLETLQLEIIDNDALINIDGLANLNSVEGSLRIIDNLALTNVDGLISLSSIGSNLSIDDNDALTNIDGLVNLSSIGGTLWIDDNYSLGRCSGAAPIVSALQGLVADGQPRILSISNAEGCRSEQDVLDSVAPKQQITDNVPSRGNVSLFFEPLEPANPLFTIEGYSATCTASDLIDFSASEAIPINDNSPVVRVLPAPERFTTTASAVSYLFVDIDITHSDPTDLYITLTTPEGTELILWDQGSSGGENLVGRFPDTLIPISDFDGIFGESLRGDWTLRIEDVHVGPIVREGVLNSWRLRVEPKFTASGDEGVVTFTGIARANYIQYVCTVAPVTRIGVFPISEPAVFSLPFQAPTDPVITSVDYGDGEITLTAAVADTGDNLGLLTYEAVCTDGDSTFKGTRTVQSKTANIVVSGLTNGVAYTCTVIASNSEEPECVPFPCSYDGCPEPDCPESFTSNPSVPTLPITPEAIPKGLPVWLLYEATK